MNSHATEPLPNTPGEAVKAGCQGDIVSLLKPAQPESAFLKLGIYGEAGSGKSYTSSLIAIGLSKLLRSTKPVAFVDTETGSDYLLPLFKREGVEMIRTKTRAFEDLVGGPSKTEPGKMEPGIIREAAVECDVLIIDSITHFWNELMASYLKANKLTRMSLQHWGPLKQTWKEYTDLFIDSRLHIIVAGRSADKWEETTEEDGAKKLEKVGTKMRVEGQFAYEPSLLVEMESVFSSARVGSLMIRRAFVKKDRFDVMDGQFFDNPTFDTFMPHIAQLNLGGDHKAFEEGRDSTSMFKRDDIGERKHIQREITLEKIQNEIKKLYPGQTQKDQLAKIAVLEEVFGTNSWTQIEKFYSNDKLAEGLNNLQRRSLKVTEEVNRAESIAENPPAVAAPAPEPTNGKPKTKGARA